VRNKPTYAVSSVDHALRLALLLQQEGPMRGSDLAERLDVARSTAHRLLAMLVYRGFAHQNDDKRYAAGPAMRAVHFPAADITALRASAMPHLRDLRDRTDETVNLQVLSGTQTRFVVTLESRQLLKVGDREGRLLPAWQVSGGKILLAALDPDEVELRLRGDEDFPSEALPALRRSLAATRRQGFAINNEATERGVIAIAHAVHGRDGDVVAAISLALPTSRHRRDSVLTIKSELRRAAHEINRALATDAAAPLQP
jgi:IclR family transcriptional regulator, acetate operon repressor